MSAVAALPAFHNRNPDDDAEDEDALSSRSYIHKRYEPYRFEHPHSPRYPPLLHPPTPTPPTTTTTTAGNYDEEGGGHARAYTHFQGGLVGPAAYGQPEDHERYPAHQPFEVFISDGEHRRGHSIDDGDMANSATSPPRTGTGTGAGDNNTLPSLKDAVRFSSSDGGARFKSDFAPPPPPQPQQQSLDYASEDYGDFDNSYPAQPMYSPSDVQQRDPYGDDGNPATMYGSAYSDSGGGGGGGGDLQHPAYRRFSTPNTALGNAAQLDQDQDGRNSYRPPFRWSADFTSTSTTGNTPASEYGYHPHPPPLPSSFAPPAPPQHSHYQPQYMQSANPYHQPVPYAHGGGTYQHPAYSRASAAVPHLFLPSHHHQQPPQSGTAYEHQPSGGAFAPPLRPGAAESAGAPPSLRLDTSHSALLGHSQQHHHHQQVSPHSATVQQPPSGRAPPSGTSPSPWSGPPPPTSLSLGASASSLAARRRNTTDFTLLNASRPGGGGGGGAAADRPRLSSTDNDSTGSSSTTTTAGVRTSLSASTSMSGLSSGPTSATSAPRGSGNSSGSGAVATLASIKEPLPSSSPERERPKSGVVKSTRRRPRRSEGEEGDDVGEREDDEGEEEEENEVEEEEDLDEDLEEAEDGGADDQDGEYRPSGTRRQQQRKSARQSLAAEDPPRRRAGGGARTTTTTAGGSDSSSSNRRSTTTTTSASSTAGSSERPSKRRKSETDADGGPLDKKFTCPHPSCGRSFARNFNLQSHIKSHQGIREFKCPECFKLFSRKHDCTRHCISIHNYDKDGVAPPDRQPLFVAQNVLPVNVMVERAQERQRAATSSAASAESVPDTQPSRNGASALGNHRSNHQATTSSSATNPTPTAPLFSGRPLALKRDADTTSPLMSHAPFVPPHPAYGNQYHHQRNYPPPGSDNGYAYHAQPQRLSPAHAFGNQQQPLPPPSLSFESSSSMPPPPSAGPDARQQQQQ